MKNNLSNLFVFIFNFFIDDEPILNIMCEMTSLAVFGGFFLSFRVLQAFRRKTSIIIYFYIFLKIGSNKYS